MNKVAKNIYNNPVNNISGTHLNNNISGTHLNNNISRTHLNNNISRTHLNNNISRTHLNNNVPNENIIDVGMFKKFSMIVVCHNSSRKLTMKSITDHSQKTTNAARLIIRDKLESVEAKIERTELSCNRINNTQHLETLDKKLLKQINSQKKYNYFLNILDEYENEFKDVNKAGPFHITFHITKTSE